MNSFAKVLLDDLEPELVPEGEYDLRIIGFKDSVSRNGTPMTRVLIKVEDPNIRNAELIIHYLTYPTPDLSPDQERRRRFDVKRFLACFGIEHDREGFDKEDLIGATARCLVIQEEWDGRVYNRLKLPWLKPKGG